MMRRYSTLNDKVLWGWGNESREQILQIYNDCLILNLISKYFWGFHLVVELRDATPIPSPSRWGPPSPHPPPPRKKFKNHEDIFYPFGPPGHSRNIIRHISDTFWKNFFFEKNSMSPPTPLGGDRFGVASLTRVGLPIIEGFQTIFFNKLVSEESWGPTMP